MTSPSYNIIMPAWVQDFLGKPDKTYETLEERMSVVIGLAMANIEKNTGGPFAAAVFDIKSKRLIGAGINLVEKLGCSVFHAEIVAIMNAQKATGSYDLGANDTSSYELVSSTEPCAMCLGAVPWSGVSRLVCAARDEDARKIGFDEGAKPTDWVRSLQDRGIEVVKDICRLEAAAVLKQYMDTGGLIYNAGDGKK